MMAYLLVFLVGAMIGGIAAYLSPLGDPEGVSQRYNGKSGNGYQPLRDISTGHPMPPVKQFTDEITPIKPWPRGEYRVPTPPSCRRTNNGR